MATISEEIFLSGKKLQSILNDVEKSAQAVDLIYVQDCHSGISRVKKAKGFHYLMGKKRVQDAVTLERIKKLVIPPAWENVWICKLENGHLQATGLDARQRKQYKYHASWTALRNHTKFFRLYEFGKCLPIIRRQLERDLSLPGLPAEKILAAVVCLMEQTSIRIGNSLYERLYGSFGLTTFKDNHVRISGDNIQFSFTGKKGIAHKISLKSKRLARIVKNCRDIPGKELFQYYDNEGNRKAVDSGMVNNYLKSITGKDFTAKDFRTWAGSIQAIKAFSEIVNREQGTDVKKDIVAVLDGVASCLGNTRTVCKKYYVHPVILRLYEEGKLNAYLQRLAKVSAKVSASAEKAGLFAEERLLLKILEKENIAGR